MHYSSCGIMHTAPALASEGEPYSTIFRQPPACASTRATASSIDSASGPGSSGACTSGITGSGFAGSAAIAPARRRGGSSTSPSRRCGFLLKHAAPRATGDLRLDRRRASRCRRAARAIRRHRAGRWAKPAASDRTRGRRRSRLDRARRVTARAIHSRARPSSLCSARSSSAINNATRLVGAAR